MLAHLTNKRNRYYLLHSGCGLRSGVSGRDSGCGLKSGVSGRDSGCRLRSGVSGRYIQGVD